MQRIAGTVVVLLWAPAPAQGAEAICDEPAVIYCNDFEAGLDGIEAEADSTIVGGELQSDLDADSDGASWDYRFAGRDAVYVRFYVRFDSSWTSVMHHFYAIHGDRTDNMWSCHGDAGCRPDGVECLSGTTVDSREGPGGEIPGEPFFYTYYPEMSCDPGNVCDNYNDSAAVCAGCASRGLPCENGPECCWGNHYNLNQGESVTMRAEQWYALETMVRANTPGQSDGEMALWVDDVLVAQHGGIGWRDGAELQLNHFQVWNYFPEATQLHRLWYDNLVISTERIGRRDMPVAGSDAGGGPGPGDPGGCCRVDGGRGASNVALAGVVLLVIRRRRGVKT